MYYTVHLFAGFECATCGKKYRQSCSLGRHIKYECQKKPRFKCIYCPYMSKHKPPVMRHMAVKHNHPIAPGDQPEKKFVCNVCGKGYTLKRNLKYHKKYRCSNKVVFSCKLCKHTCSSRYKVRGHLKLCHDMDVSYKDTKHYMDLESFGGYIWFDPPEYNCPDCFKIYAKKSTLARHIKYECCQLPRFGCTMCSYRGYQKTHVERHLSRRHDVQDKFEIRKKILKYKCSLCGKAYKNHKSLVRHLTHECQKEPTEECRLCGHRTIYKSALKKHMLSKHSADVLGLHSQRELCYVCANSERFGDLFVRIYFFVDETAEEAIRNLLTGVERKYQCTKCLRRYKNSYILKRHVELECGIEPKFQCTLCGHKSKRKHKCEKCGRSYLHRQTLKRHVLYECGIKPSMSCYRIECSICGRFYKNAKNLRQHLRYECQKEPQFACSYCPYKAKLKSNLNKHQIRCSAFRSLYSS
ncbi:unnamed protein product [Phyllotreta striolata]|uniref:C2H2-type domain-containing protein n=1 Tax=Phyllotreta striolata TaxID=444603 RepID=A0A9N9TYW9_PHYSR|nr:unnamed protein product [Phyllotreta striolata]